jgi:hypothetical protein
MGDLVQALSVARAALQGDGEAEPDWLALLDRALAAPHHDGPDGAAGAAQTAVRALGHAGAAAGAPAALRSQVCPSRCGPGPAV